MVVDKEACGYMDETMRLFEMYKEKYTLGIERKHKEIEMKVCTPIAQSMPTTRRQEEYRLGGRWGEEMYKGEGLINLGYGWDDEEC